MPSDAWAGAYTTLAPVPGPSAVPLASISKVSPFLPGLDVTPGRRDITRYGGTRESGIFCLRFGHMHGGTVAWAESRRTFGGASCVGSRCTFLGGRNNTPETPFITLLEGGSKHRVFPLLQDFLKRPFLEGIKIHAIFFFDTRQRVCESV